MEMMLFNAHTSDSLRLLYLLFFRFEHFNNCYFLNCLKALTVVILGEMQSFKNWLQI